MHSARPRGFGHSGGRADQRRAASPNQVLGELGGFESDGVNETLMSDKCKRAASRPTASASPRLNSLRRSLSAAVFPFLVRLFVKVKCSANVIHRRSTRGR